jgi:hypothetical protein
VALICMWCWIEYVSEAERSLCVNQMLLAVFIADDAMCISYS